LLRPRLAVLRTYYLVSFAALGAYLPYFPRWLEARGIQGLRLSVIAAMLPIMGLAAPPVFGFVADALHLRGWLLRIACAGALCAFVVVGGSALAGAPLGFWGLVPALAGFAFFRSPMVMMADVLALEEAATGVTTYGRIRLWGSLGFLLAAMAAGRFVDADDLTVLPCAIAASLAGALVITLALPARPRGEITRDRVRERMQAAKVRELLRAPDFRLFLLTSFLSQVAHSAYDLGYTLHLRDLGVSGGAIGAAWAIGVVAEIVLMVWAAPLFGRTPAPALLVLGVAGASLRWGLIALVRSEVLLFALQPLHALSFGVVWLASVSYSKDRAAPEILATSQGLFVAATGVGSIVGIFAWGPLYQQAGGRTMFGMASAFAAAATLSALAFRARAR
jgi:PPP family 3-phenylpropionic acid transporter